MMKKLEFISISSVRSRKKSFTYRSRIDPVSIPYQSRIILRSSFVRPSFMVLSFSLPEAETIRKQYGNNTEAI